MRNFKIRQRPKGDRERQCGFQLVGFAQVTDRGEIMLPSDLKQPVTVIAELQSAIKYLRSESAAFSVETVSGFEVSRQSPKLINNQSLWGTERR